MAKNLAVHPAPNTKSGTNLTPRSDTKKAANPASDHSCWLIVFEDVSNISKKEKIGSYAFEAFIKHPRYLAEPHPGKLVGWISSIFAKQDDTWEQNVIVTSDLITREVEPTEKTCYVIWRVDKVPAGSSMRILLGINHRIDNKQADDAFEFQDVALSDSAKLSVNADRKFQDASDARFEIEIMKVVGDPEIAIANEVVHIHG